jgi:uncharacterized membrane protein SirB2
MSYLAVKHIHITFAVLSLILFFVRGLLMIAESPLLQRRFLKIVPHVVDTGLLAAAITLAVWGGMYPFAQSWLTAKLIGLVLYIVLGTIALKRGKTKGVRIAAFAGALAVFGYVVMVAVTKQPF